MPQLIAFVRKNQWLLLILFLAFLFRFVGVRPGYNSFHPDEPILTGKAIQMIKRGNLDPGRYDYPTLSIYVDFLFFKFFFTPIYWMKYYLTNIIGIIDGVIHIPPSALEAKRLFQVEILGVRDISALFWGRYVSALFSLGCVFLIYLLGCKLFNKSIGLVAAFLLIFNFKHVANSHINLPDTYNSFFLLLSIIASVNLWQRPSKKNYILGGIAAGLFFSTKYQFFALFPFGLAHLYRSRNPFSYIFISSGLVFLLVFLILNAYFFINIELALYWMASVSGRYAVGTNNLNLFPLSYLYKVDYGQFESIMILIGSILILRKSFRKGSFLFVTVIPFAFMFLYYTGGGLFVRNFITITPILLLLAAYGIWNIYKFFNKRIIPAFSTLVLFFLLLGSVYVPAKNSLINSYYYTKPWNINVLKDWQRQILPDSVAIAAHPFDPVEGPSNVIRSEFEISGNYSLNEHREAGADWALVNLMWAANPFYFWMGYGFKDLNIYWDKPIDQLRNMYHGLATEELFRYQVFSVTKPWQAPEFNYVMIKFPEWPEVQMKAIKLFDFSDGTQGWSFGYDDKIGHSSPGSIAVELSGDKFPYKRITSEPMEVKPGRLYKVEGFLKTGAILPSNQRDGLLRIDFYSEVIYSADRVGLISSVSSRAWGSDDWFKKQVIERAPGGAKYMVVSLQVGSSGRTKIWADDIVVEESDSEIVEITSQPPYLDKPIDLNLLYFNSIGNL